MLRVGIEIPPARNDEAWDAMDRILAKGWQPKAIAEVSGVGLPTIHAQLRHRRDGARRKWSRASAERIITAAGRIDVEATTGKLSIVGTRRRLRALAAIGWGVRALIRAAVAEGHPPFPESTLHYIRKGNDDHVTPASARWVAAVYEAFSMRPAPAGRAATATIRNANRNRWSPPLAYDEGSIDDPSVAPGVFSRNGWGEKGLATEVEEAAVLQCIEGRYNHRNLTLAEREEVVRRLHRQGFNDREIAARTGITDSGVQRIRKRLDLPANVYEAPAPGTASKAAVA